ncbi:class II aldolase/adducin family protein [Chitinivorax sp. B]|uniref:class II aldolase/adducin family protein n=1 Tax=Chitinivorax sp. B TaxID=2502235 RepID=UPI0010F7C9CF|nr:class II aldolase/adducin family protein [Chitinivorax sp. B]
MTTLENVALNVTASGANRLARPHFDTFEHARRHALIRLTAAFRLFAHFGFDEGVAGHITVRDPEHPDQFWVNPLGLHFSEIKVSNLVRVDHQGKVLHGHYPVNLAAFAIHAAVHQARPDVMAVAHAHSMHGKTWSSLGRELAPITQDACAFYEDHRVYDRFGGVVHQTSEGQDIAHCLGQGKALILQNHGLLTVGNCVDIASWFFISMERCCQSQLLAEAAGTPKLIDHATACKTRDLIASDFVAYGSFQPLYHFIVKQQPDLLE